MQLSKSFLILQILIIFCTLIPLDWKLLSSSHNSFTSCYTTVPVCKTAVRLVQGIHCGLLCGSDGKESSCNEEDPGSTAGLEWSPGEGKGYPLQYSCLENPMDRGAGQATVHRVARVRHDLATKPPPEDVQVSLRYPDTLFGSLKVWNTDLSPERLGNCLGRTLCRIFGR